ncbi:hypothetical protein NIA69_22020 [Gemmiger formicilis]|nr:hypothetical protein [Gemmiger formicilis]
MSEKRKTLEITLWVDAIRRANDSLRDQQRKYEAAQADYDRLSRQLDEFDEKARPCVPRPSSWCWPSSRPTPTSAPSPKQTPAARARSPS